MSFCSRPVSLTSQKGWLQGTEFSDYNSYFHLSLHIQALVGTVVTLKGAKVIKNMMRRGREALFYLVFFFSYMQVFPWPYLIATVFLQEPNLFLTVNSEILAQESNPGHFDLLYLYSSLVPHSKSKLSEHNTTCNRFVKSISML